MTGRRNWIRSLFALALVAVFVSAGTLFAGKGGNKPPKDDPPPEPPTISYSMKLLGTLGGASSSAMAMNELGDVVGESEMVDGGDSFVYFNNTGTMHRLGDLVTAADQDKWHWTSNKAYGINSQGQICMWLQQKVPHHASHAVRISLVFDEDGIVVPGQAEVEIVAPDPSYATDINEFGDVTGEYGYTGAFVYSDEIGFDDIGDLGGGYAHPAAINNFGQVAGTSENAAGETFAFRYTPGLGMAGLGVIETAGPNNTDRSVGRDLNDLGDVVGWATAGKRKGLSVYHAFREAGQGMESLGTLGKPESWAKSVNSSGAIIGEAYDTPNRDELEFLYTDEIGMVELAPLITNLPPDTGFVTRQINDAGQICGTIYLADGAQAFLLTPNP